MADKTEWFKDAVAQRKPDTLGGWRKEMPKEKRREDAVNSRPKNWKNKKKYLSVARALQALSNVTKDSETKRVAKQDADYFFEKAKYKGKKFEKGGISNRYEETSAETVWNDWTSHQRKHFLIDHNQRINEIYHAHGHINTELNSYNFSSNLYRELPDAIKAAIDEHVQKGRYEKGGKIDTKMLNEMMNGYMSAVLFTGIDENEEPLDRNYDTSDFDPETKEKIKRMLIQYIIDNRKVIKSSGMEYFGIGSDIWYTQSGQGVGFFDRNLPKTIEEKLTEEAEKYVRLPDLYVQNGKVYLAGGWFSKKFAHGGQASDNDHFRYINIEKLPHALKISLNKEGKELIEEQKEQDHPDSSIWADLFEDVQGNSEYLFHYDMGDAGFGLTSAEGITDGYHYSDNGEYETDYPESAEVYWFPNYQIESSIDTLLKDGFVEFDRAFKHGGLIPHNLKNWLNEKIDLTKLFK